MTIKEPPDEILKAALVSTVKFPKVIFSVVLIVLLVLGLVAGGAYAFTNFMPKELTPEELLTEAYFEMLEADRGTVTSTMKFEEINFDNDDPTVEMIIDLILIKVRLPYIQGK